MAARTGQPYKLQVLSTNGERKLQGSANNPTLNFTPPPKLLKLLGILDKTVSRSVFFDAQSFLQDCRTPRPVFNLCG